MDDKKQLETLKDKIEEKTKKYVYGNILPYDYNEINYEFRIKLKRDSIDAAIVVRYDEKYLISMVVGQGTLDLQDVKRCNLDDAIDFIISYNIEYLN